MAKDQGPDEPEKTRCRKKYVRIVTGRQAGWLGWLAGQGLTDGGCEPEDTYGSTR